MSRIKFREDGHVYTDGEINYCSVTTFLGKFQQPFNREHWAIYGSLKKVVDDFKLRKNTWEAMGKSINDPEIIDYLMQYVYDFEELVEVKKELLKEWKETNKKSIVKGNLYHITKEEQSYERGWETNPFTGKKFKTFQKERIEGENESLAENLYDLEDGYYPELLIWNEGWKLAGQSDKVFIETEGKKRYAYLDDYKGLALDTPIPTENGFINMGDLKVGDEIFDGNGDVTKITNVSEIHNNPCYKLTFDRGDHIIADHEHKWVIYNENEGELEMTTEQIFEHTDFFDEILIIKCPDLFSPYADSFEFRKILKVEVTDTVPTKCLTVESPTHTYLASKSFIKTHNSNKKLSKRGMFFKNYGTVMMKPPIDNLEQSKMQLYELQLTMYGYMLEQFGFTVKGVCLHHLNQKHVLEYKKKEVKKLLEYEGLPTSYRMGA